MSVFIRFGRCCAYCGDAIQGQPDPDHVIPLSRGGHNTIGNILPSCRPCNSRPCGGKPVRTTWSLTDPLYAHLTISHVAHAA